MLERPGFIEIENAKNTYCSNCRRICLIENDDEILYRNVGLMYTDKRTGNTEIKCAWCKSITKINT